MEEVLLQLVSSLDSVKKIVSFYEELESLLSDSKSQRSEYVRIVSGKYFTIKSEQRKLLYGGIVISIYGAWESFVRKMIIKFAMTKFLHDSDCKNYPGKFRVAYIDKYIEYISKKNNEWKCSDECQSLLDELCAGVKGSTCLINEEIYFKNYSNYRIGVVNDLFSTVGVKDIATKVTKCEKFKDIMCIINPAYSSVIDEAMRYRLAYNLLEDLVIERNAIAHGKENVQLMSVRLLVNLSDYVRVLGECILDVFRGELGVDSSDVKEILVFTKKIGGSVGMFSVVSRVEKGDCIYVEKGNDKIEKRTILGIYDDSESEVRSAAPDMIVSIKFDKKIKEGWKFLRKDTGQHIPS